MYVCDLCEARTENEEEIEQCWLCGTDVCEGCYQTFRHSIETDSAEDELFVDFQVVCNNCAQDGQKIVDAFKQQL